VPFPNPASCVDLGELIHAIIRVFGVAVIIISLTSRAMAMGICGNGLWVAEGWGMVMQQGLLAASQRRVLQNCKFPRFPSALGR
jgi:hypothetical protein